MATKRKGNRVGLVSKLILCAFLLYSAVTLISLQVQIHRQKQEMASLQEQVTQEEAKGTELQQKLDDKVDDNYIVSEAQKQGLAKPDERVYVDVSGS